MFRSRRASPREVTRTPRPRGRATPRRRRSRRDTRVARLEALPGDDEDEKGHEGRRRDTGRARRRATGATSSPRRRSSHACPPSRRRRAAPAALPTRRLDGHREDRRGGRNAVEDAEATQAAPARAARRQHGREERKRLLARLVCHHAEREQPGWLSRVGRSSMRTSTSTTNRRSGRTRSRSSTCPCRRATGSQRTAPPPQRRTAGRARAARGDTPAWRRATHYRVDRLRGLVRVRHRGEGSVRRADQRGIDDSVRRRPGRPGSGTGRPRRSSSRAPSRSARRP